jgi:capsid protein
MSSLTKVGSEAPWTWPVDRSTGGVSATSYIAEPSYGTGYYDGEQFWGGITGKIDEISGLDYWTLRERSGALFRTNNYAQGIVRRLITNVIHKGLSPEFGPEESVIGAAEDTLVEWADARERQYRLYCHAKSIIDCKGYRIDGELQQQIYEESFIDGDCLVVCRLHSTGLPQIQIVSGSRVQTPPDRFLDPSIIDGVHLDTSGKHLGYWVYKGTEYIPDDQYVYIPAYGKQTGRRTAWLVYGPIKREDDVRGMPGLGVAIQPLNEILKYRGSAQLKAELGARITGFIKREKETLGRSVLGKGAARRDSLAADPTGDTPETVVNRILPGTYLTRLAPGEEPFVYPNQGTDVNFPGFETAIIAGLAWSFEIPPEVLLLSYNSNFSASQAAVRELNMFLERERERFASQHCQNQLEEWFVASVLISKIEAPGFLEAYANQSQYDVKQAWLNVDWIGSVKPSLKLNDEVIANKNMVEAGWQTNARAARGMTGTSFDRNIRKLAKENRMKAEAMRPLLQLQQEFGAKNVADAFGLLRVVGTGPMVEIEKELEAV